MSGGVTYGTFEKFLNYEQVGAKKDLNHKEEHVPC